MKQLLHLVALTVVAGLQPISEEKEQCARDLNLIYCDLGHIDEWPEAALINHLFERLRKTYTGCDSETILEHESDLYVSLPARSEKSEEGEGVRTDYRFLRSTKFQFHARISDFEVPVRTSEGSPEQADVPPEERGEGSPENEVPPQPLDQALPDRAVSLDELPAEREGGAGSLDRFHLMELVFVPRIVNSVSETVSGLGRGDAPIFLIPATALPTRLIRSKTVENSALPIELETWRGKLEVAGIEFLRVVKEHHSYSDASRKHLVRSRVNNELGPGYLVTRKELLFFEQVLRRRLKRLHGASPGQDHLNAFFRFWQEVDRRGKKLLELNGRQETSSDAPEQ